MSTPFIRSVIARIPVRPTPLFQDDVDSADSHDDDAAAVEETLATQGPETSGEDNELGPKVGLMNLAGYVDMREPWVEGLKSEKVSSLSELVHNLADSWLVVHSASDGVSSQRHAELHLILKFDEGGRVE
jgi:hypothetical protein